MAELRTDNYFSFPGFRGLSANTLKIIAIVTMFIDHFAAVFETELADRFPFLVMENGLNVLRAVGRVAFPIFAFLIAEGAKRTHNRWLYLLRLGVFAVISEIPFDLAFNDTSFETGVIEFESQNVFFTRFLGLLSIVVMQLLDKINLAPLSFVFTLAAAWAAEEVLHTDYGAAGVLAIFLFYLFLQTNSKVKAVGVVAVCLLLTIMFSFRFSSAHPMYLEEENWNIMPFFSAGDGRYYRYNLYSLIGMRYNKYEIWCLAAAPLLILYNGGKGKHKINKYVFYVFYPAHILLLWAVYTLFFAGGQG